MNTTVYLYQTETEALAGVLGQGFATKRLRLLEELEHALPNERQAVVVFAPDADDVGRIQAQITRFKTLLASAVCVVLLNELPSEDTELLKLDAVFAVRSQPDFVLRAQVASAVRQAELLTTLEDGSHQDEVTGLYNRDYFLKRLSEEISLSRRHLSPLCCVVIGVNFYQMYLDSYGHDFINKLLGEAALVIQSYTRHEDLLARTGDGEIGILLPRSSEKGAKVVTHRIVEQLNTLVIHHSGAEEHLSVCAGVAGYPLPEGEKADADTIIRYARHALHNARCNAKENVQVQLFSEIAPAI